MCIRDSASPGSGNPKYPAGLTPNLIEVDGRIGALNPDPSWQIEGDLHFTLFWPLSKIKTRDWAATTGKVEFVLKESSSNLGPWLVERCRFEHEAGQPAKDFSFAPSLGNPTSWWLLKVKALTASEFVAPPFAY